MDFPPILEDFSCMDIASFDFDDFIFGTGDAEAVQSGVRASTATRATKTTRASGGAPSHPSGSRPPQLSRGDSITIVHSLETHACTLHRLPVISCLLSLLFALLAIFLYRIALTIILV